jgi:molybdopterin biosynthesis enzyme
MRSQRELAVGAGTRLGPGELGLLAALGVAAVEVVRRPRVALIATGDELVDVSAAPGPSQIVDSPGYMLAAMVEV